MPWYYDFSVPHDNAFLRFVRKIYKPLHFEKGYNFPLWVIFGGAIFGFGCARVEYLDINGIFRENKIINGDWEYWQSGFEHVGIILHLAAVIPICFLLPWQFLPIVRHAAMLFHRINGYLLILLLMIGNAGAFMITRHSMGGELATQIILYGLGTYTTIGIWLAYYNIKRLQIDQHRAWMLRVWVTAGAIISLRLIQLAAMDIVTDLGDYYFPMACHTISYINTNTAGPQAAQAIMQKYAQCQRDPVNGWASVNMSMNGTPEEIGAAVSGVFALSSIVALALHIFGVECYLWLTRAEGERLKQVSYEKQLARGMKRPGDAGLTPNMWGDLPRWQPAEKLPERVPSGAALTPGDESDGSLQKVVPEEV